MWPARYSTAKSFSGLPAFASFRMRLAIQAASASSLAPWKCTGRAAGCPGKAVRRFFSTRILLWRISVFAQVRMGSVER